MSNAVPLPPSALQEAKDTLLAEQKVFGLALEQAFADDMKARNLDIDDVIEIVKDGGFVFTLPTQGFDMEKARDSNIWKQTMFNLVHMTSKYVKLEYERKEGQVEQFVVTLSC